MKTTITEEYEDGQLVRRTTVTDGEYATGGYLYPTSCTCGQPWNSILPPPPCPTHGQAWPATITCGTASSVTPPPPGSSTVTWQAYWDKLASATITVKTDTDATPAEIAAEVGARLRSVASTEQFNLRGA